MLTPSKEYILACITAMFILIGTITLAGCENNETSSGGGSQTNAETLVLDDAGNPRVIQNFNQVTNED